MIVLLLAAAATAAPAPPEQLRFEACVTLTAKDPARALDEANSWSLAGGGALAKQCSGMAYAALARWKPAAVAFEQAARRFEGERDAVAAARLWVQSGNAALAGGDARTARERFNAALGSGALTGAEAGEAHLDRARAAYAMADAKAVRTDLEAALTLVPQDPLAWLLSATAARRAGDLPRAATDIAEARKRAPDDAGVALESGNIAVMMGEESKAREAWAAAVKAAPESEAGKTAATLIARLDAANGGAAK